MKRLSKRFFLLIVFIAVHFSVAAEIQGDEKAIAIAKERKARDIGWGTNEAKVLMVLKKQLNGPKRN